MLEALRNLPLSSRDSRSARPLHITASRQTTLTDARAVPSNLGKPNAPPTPAAELVDYSASALHRFSRGLPAKLPYGPCSTLYFGNAPLAMTESALSDALASVGAPRPTAIKFLQGGDPGSAGAGRDKAGFADFGDATSAAYALMFANHMAMDADSGSPIFLRLSFASRRMSSAPDRPAHGGAGAGAGGDRRSAGAGSADYDAGAADGAPDGLSAIGAGSSGAAADHSHDEAAAAAGDAVAEGVAEDEAAPPSEHEHAPAESNHVPAEAGAGEAPAEGSAAEEEARAYSPTGAADL